jgi:translation initiation factor IF-3
LSLAEALKMADEEGLDLVEIASNQDMPVVRIMDYRKYRFEQIKKAKEAKKKQRVIHVKEIKVRPGIDSHDYDHKVKHARSFLTKGDKVKFTMMFRGREIVHTDLGQAVMKRIHDDLIDCSVVEKPASLEGKNLAMILAPAAAVGGGSKKPSSKEQSES